MASTSEIPSKKLSLMRAWSRLRPESARHRQIHLYTMKIQFKLYHFSACNFAGSQIRALGVLTPLLPFTVPNCDATKE